MNPTRFYKLLGIDPSRKDRLEQAQSRLADAAISVKSKDPRNTVYLARQGGRSGTVLDDLAANGLFSVSRERGINRYTPTNTFADFWRTYVRLRRTA